MKALRLHIRAKFACYRPVSKMVSKGEVLYTCALLALLSTHALANKGKYTKTGERADKLCLITYTFNCARR